MMKRNIILMGPPGAGKGTLATSLKDELKLVHVSTGDMFREAIKNGTPLGKEAKSYLDSGNLVPDSVTIGLVKERLSQDDCKDGFLLDGFPRTLVQAEALDELSKEINRPIEVVINLTCDENALIERISGRRVCPKCGTPYHTSFKKPQKENVCDVCGNDLYQRPDDNENALKVRLQHYANDTKPLLDYYDKQGLLASFDANNSIKHIFDEVINFLKK